MTYSVKEIHFTLQGEGAQTGRAGVFLRFSGCNLWSGREQHRSSAVCRFCDTDFVGTNGRLGGKYPNAESLADAVESCWDSRSGRRPFVVCTGGEPLLQLDAALLAAFHVRAMQIAIETNGTLIPPPGIDWVCVSPKGRAPLVVKGGDELKLVYPQTEPEAQPECFESLEFDHFFLQPLDSDHRDENTRRTIEYCYQNPQWKLSLQTHKLLGID